MAANGESDARTLAELRSRIDAIDEAIHGLLIDRGSVIEALIAAKGTQQTRAAFRPQREAEMMRGLAARHRGELPLTTVEHLWREIITTFTFMQAPFRLVIDYGEDHIAIQDLARFAFGFSIEFVTARDPFDVVAQVFASGTDLGLIPLVDDAGAPAWWRSLSDTIGPRLMAVLPFITPKGRTASAPAFVISPLLTEPSPPDLRAVAATGIATTEAALNDAAGIAILTGTGPAARRELLLAVADDVGDETLAARGLSALATVGGIARGVTLDGRSGALRAPLTDRSKS